MNQRRLESPGFIYNPKLPRQAGAPTWRARFNTLQNWVVEPPERGKKVIMRPEIKEAARRMAKRRDECATCARDMARVRSRSALRRRLALGHNERALLGH